MNAHRRMVLMPTDIPLDLSCFRGNSPRNADLFFNLLCALLVSVWVIGLWGVALHVCYDAMISIDSLDAEFLLPS